MSAIGTRRWNNTRQHFADLLDTLGHITCWRCQHPITPNMQWDLGHVIDRQDGGTDDTLAPEHRYCNRSAGATAGNRRRRPTTAPNTSIHWLLRGTFLDDGSR